MLVQVLRGKPYNAKVDIFSFGVVMYQLFSKQNVSSRFETEDQVLEFAKSVARGRRLAMPQRFSKPLTELIDLMWADDPRVRPTARKALELLKAMHPQVSAAGGGTSGRAGGGSFGGWLPTTCLCVAPSVTE